MVQDDDSDDFASLMQGDSDIKVYKHEASIRDRFRSVSKLELDAGKEIQRLAALGESRQQIDLESLPPEKYGPNDIMEFKQAGVQEGVYKKLRTGRYSIEAKLDLHGRTVNEALSEVRAFISRSLSKQKRCVHISHGKGIKQVEPARLKNHLAAWLKHMPEVMAYHSAMPQHGGTGCVYVLLKKSEQKKQENRERFSQARKH